MIDDKVNVKKITGLSELEASSKLKEEGYNELPSAKNRSIFSLILDVIKEPMFLLLIACGTVYLLLGDVEEALMLLSFVFVIIGITLYQKNKTERALESLRDLTSPRAQVVRDGKLRRIPGREVVRDDILVLSEGDRVPADAVLLSCSNLLVDESLLTGESVPVRKVPWDKVMEMTRPGGDDLPFVYSGTLIVQGRGIAKVLAIGSRTEIGKIGKSLKELEPGETLLKKETNKLVKNFAIFGVILCILVVFVYGIKTYNWLEGFLAGITLAMAILPEEIPVILTVFLALGAWRMSQKRVLTRRIEAIHALGSATVLCVDKTGTLTLNRMTIKRLFANEKFFDVTEKEIKLPENFHELLEFGILASQRKPFDPLEKSLKELGLRTLYNTEHIKKDWTLVYEYPLSKKLLAVSHVWKSSSGKDYIIAAKGAPEAIIDLCHMNEKQKKILSEHINAMANDGLRVIGVARGKFKEKSLPDKQHDFKFEFVGLIGLEDPVRLNVSESIKECHNAEIRVIMITGDYPGTAKHVAQKIGMAYDNIITGSELDGLDDLKLQELIKNVNIFARVVPEQKLRIVNALKANGEVVVMTGDGVNDAPALKAADIGIAMGGRGTDVAREASSLVLLDDDFSSIVKAVKMGRKILDNIKKAMAYTFAVHVPIAGMSLIPVMLNWSPVLLPIHVVFLELIIDPACSIVFEAGKSEEDVMKRPPHRLKDPLFTKRNIFISVVQGLVALVIVLSVFGIAFYRVERIYARTLSFVSLVAANIGLIFTNLSWKNTIVKTLRSKNTALWFVLFAVLVFLALVLYVPFLTQLFHFEFLKPIDLAISFIVGIASVMWFELFKISKKINL